MTVRLGASGGERSESLPGGPDCLEPDAIMGLVQGWLEPDDLRKAEAHIDCCDECRRCVSEFARTSAELGDEGGAPAAPLATGRDEGEPTARPAESGRTVVLDQGESTDGHFFTSGSDGAFAEVFLPRGALLGRYVVDGLLGAGGMGVVYAAFDPKLDRKVALKLLRAGEGAGPDARERLLREARAMARLSHPNVVSVYDVDVHEGRLFLAMEYVDGVTLRSWLRREARPPLEVLRALVRAGRGLSAAHAVGVVHRDVKPDNVLVDVRGRVCVTDFGLARAASGARPEAPPEGSAGPSNPPGGPLAGSTASPGGPLAGPAGSPGGSLAGATRTGSLIGTPAYMAPEQHKGRPADAKSDQFSFCVMLYEALYRRRPFEGDTFRALADAVTGGKMREPPSLAPVVPRVRKAILRGLSVDPAERFESMDALLEALSGDRGARRRVVALGGAVAAVAALTAGYRYARSDARPTCQGAELKLAGVWDETRKGAVRGAFLATGKPFAADAFRGVERALDKYTGAWAAARVDACEATQVRGEQSAELLDLRMACLDDRLKEVAALGEVFSRADAEVVTRAVGAAQSLSPLGPCGDAKALRARVRPPAEPAAAAKVEAQRGELARAQALSEAGKYREALQLVEGVGRVADELGYRPLQAEARLQEGRLQLRTGDVKRSEATLERAVTAADAAGDDATRALAYSTLVFSIGALQARHEQVAFFNEQARAALDRLGGDAGIDGLCRGNFAAALRRQGRSDEALREQAASIIALERAFGPESRQVLTGLYGLGNAHLGRRDLDAAAGAFRHYLERSEHALGPHHPSVAEGLSGLGTVLLVQAHSAEALPHLERALAIMEGALGPESKTLTPYLDNLGSALGDQGQHKRALAYFERSLALSEKQLGPDHPLLLWPLTGLGEAYLGLGDYPKAIAHLERALERQGTADAAADLAIARFALARALSESGRDRRRARTLALAARDAYRSFKNGPLDERNLRRVDEWLERHPQG